MAAVLQGSELLSPVARSDLLSFLLEKIKSLAFSRKRLIVSPSTPSGEDAFAEPDFAPQPLFLLFRANLFLSSLSFFSELAKGRWALSFGATRRSHPYPIFVTP